MTKKNKNHHEYHKINNHDGFLITLPKIAQKSKNFKILLHPKEFFHTLLSSIHQAYQHIYIIALYLENDLGGKKIIDTILYIKKLRPNLKIKIIVDWHRARRSRIGESTLYTNTDWYYDIIHQHPDIQLFSIHGVPININEALGVLHLKGCIIDQQILYSGANLNNEYLNIHNKYRRDRYHIIQNPKLANIMIQYIEDTLLTSKIASNFKNKITSKIFIKNNIRLFRKKLRTVCYNYNNNATFDEFSITPLVGLGKKSILNQTVYHLIASVKQKVILCTPYFNIPTILIHNLIYLLKTGKNIEIIVGDKTTNDFYNPHQEYKPFKLISALPYLYEINLRFFSKKLQNYIDNQQLIIRLWKNGDHGYHIKGIWADNEWQLITGSNLNPRSLRFDLENGLLIHDPKQELALETNQELENIRLSTKLIQHYISIPDIYDYPPKIKQLIQRIRKIRFDKIIKYLL